MALLPILSYPDPRLRTIAKPVKEVTAEIKTLIADMIETMYDAQGIGLAASQVDRHIQLIVMDLSEDKNSPRVFINPKVTPLVEEKQPYEEGCLSVPEVYDKVERPTKVRIEALDENGNKIDEEVEGLLAVLNKRGRVIKCVKCLKYAKNRASKSRINSHKPPTLNTFIF